MACDERDRSLRTRWRTRHSALFLFLCLLSLLCLLGLTLASLQRFLLFSATLGLLGRLLGLLGLLSFLLCLLLLGTLLRLRSALLLCAALCFGSGLFLASLLSALLGGLLPGLFGPLPLDALRIFGRLLCPSSVLLRLRRLRRSLFGRRDRARGNDGLRRCRRNRIWCDDRSRLRRRRDRRSRCCRGRRHAFWFSRSS